MSTAEDRPSKGPGKRRFEWAQLHRWFQGSPGAAPDDPKRRRWVFAALAVWPLMVAPGFYAVEQYASAPGKLADAPATWPASVAVEREPGVHTVVMLAHPRCPCTRSSLREMSKLMTAVGKRAEGIVLFADPAGEQWDRTDLWDIADGIPGVRALSDEGSAVAGALGAYTSGQVLVYDPEGALVFNGGITKARGHDGDNLGEATIVDIVNQGSAARATTDVYGCDLHQPEKAE
jgi:hypothetical protein